MQAIALRLLAVLGPLAQHLAAYAELGVAAAGEYRAAWMRRVCWMLVAAFFGLFGLVAAWMIGVAWFWDTPWRLTYVIASAAVLLLVAIIAAILAVSKPHPGQAAGLLREELNKDRELWQEWTRTM